MLTVTVLTGLCVYRVKVALKKNMTLRHMKKSRNTSASVFHTLDYMYTTDCTSNRQRASVFIRRGKFEKKNKQKRTVQRIANS